MNKVQQLIMLEFIAQGNSWEDARSKAGISFAQFFETLHTGHNSKSGPEYEFVKELESVGRLATQKELASLRKKAEVY